MFLFKVVYVLNCLSSFTRKILNVSDHSMISGVNKKMPCFYLTWPMAKLSTFWDDEYLVGKISRSNLFFFRVQDG